MNELTVSLIIAGVVLFYVASGIVGYGLTFAVFQGEFPNIADEMRDDDRQKAMLVGICGPFGLLGVVSGIWQQRGFRAVYRHGLKFR